MEYTILLPKDIREKGKQYLRDRGYHIKPGKGRSEGEIAEDIRDCDGVLVCNDPITERVLSHANRLKVIGRHGIGVDNIDLKKADELGIAVTNAPFANVNSVAEHTIALMLACTKQLTIMDRRLKTGDYECRTQILGCELEGKTLGLIGMGRIGRSVARKAAGLNMKVIGYDLFLPPGAEMGDIRRKERIEDVFAEADIVSLHIPATEETRHNIGIGLFSLMKKRSWLINTSRGSVLCEQELCQAIEKEMLAGAGLDVFEEEPPSVDNPLFLFPQVIVTPHSAAMTEEAMEQMGVEAAMGIDDVLSGRTPAWLVNKPE